MNIVMIMADQLAAPALPFHRHSVVQAPNMAALAEHGVVFDNAYCNSPLCAPSRFSMMTGKLPSRIGGYDNASELAATEPTLAHYLRGLGYFTCLSGKMHFVGPDQLHGFEERLTTDIYPADFGWTPDWEHPDERIDWWYHNALSIKQAGIAEATNQLDFDDETGHQALRKIRDLARAGERRPFFLLVSFTHPHDPYACRSEYWHRYHHDDIDLPSVGAMPVDELDPHSQRLHRVSALGQYPIADEDIRNARHAYYGNISYVDDWVGRIVECLRRTGLAEDTSIVLTADHGDMLGERGLWYKMSFFEWSARVPLLLHAPGRFAAQRVDTPVSLLDLAPTLVDLAGMDGIDLPESIIEAVSQLEGNSLLEVLEGADSSGSQGVVGEYLGEGAVAPCFMLRRGPYKYVGCSADPEQLYDLVNDPKELSNLTGDAASARVVQSFREQTLQRWNTDALRQAVITNQKQRHLVFSALSRGSRFPWDYQPYRDASAEFMRNHLNLNDLEARSRFPPAPGV